MPLYPASSSEIDRYADEQQLLDAAYGILAATFDRRCVPTTVGSYASGTVRAGAVGLTAGVTVGTLGLCIVTAGVGLTAARLGVYDSAFSLRGQTADMSVAFGSAGWKTAALTVPYAIPTTGLYYLAVFQTYATTAALMAADNAAGVTNAREAIVGGGARGGWKQVGQVALPDPAVPTESGFMPL